MDKLAAGLAWSGDVSVICLWEASICVRKSTWSFKLVRFSMAS